jgi:predicted nucleic acid-binding protein
MIIERTSNEVIFRLPGAINVDDLQDMTDLFEFMEIAKKSKAKQRDVDEDDCEFVALTDHIIGKLWSGDKQLVKGLLKKNWNNFISTEELYEILIKRK